MMEAALVEKYIYENLTSLAALQGFRVEIAPFDTQKLQNDPNFKPLPVIYFRYASGLDEKALGPGPRIMSSLLYEIGVFHDGNSFGATFADNNGGPRVTLIAILSAIDTFFQDFATPATVDGGTIFSVTRETPVRVPERGPDGKLYKRDGGLYRFNVQKAAA